MDPSSMLNSTLVPLSRKACLTPISPSKDSNSTDPIIAQIQLGIHLRDLRLVADLNIVDVAQDLDCSGAKISKVENGKQGISAAEVATTSLYRFVGHERCITRAIGAPGGGSIIDQSRGPSSGCGRPCSARTSASSSLCCQNSFRSR
jgi:hypothetical protein